MHCRLTVAQILAYYPALAWHEPIRIQFLGGGPVTDFGCRFCIAQEGLDAARAELHPKTRAQFDFHMEHVHEVKLQEQT